MASAKTGRALMAAPFGAVLLTEECGVLASVELTPFPESPIAPDSPLLRDAVRQFQRYFDDPLWVFTLPLKELGTAFQRRVWSAMREIPVGEAYSYGRLARELESSPRAVAGACRGNEFPVIIPCHRVVSTQGLGGYCGRLSGPYLDIKIWLLRHEGYGAG